MKNVFIVSDFCAPYPGNFVASLKELEARMSSDCHFYYFFRQSESEPFLSWYRKFSIGRECCLISFDSDGSRKLAGKINQNKPFLICFHFGGLSFPYKVYRLCSKEAKKVCRFLIHVHSNPSFHKGAVPAVKRFFAKILCPKSFSFIACSQEISKLLSRQYKKQKIFLNPNGIDKSRLFFSPGKMIPENSHIAIMFGYDYFVKGVDIAASIAEKYYRVDPKFHLYIVAARCQDEIRNKLQRSYPNFNESISIISPRQNVREIYDLASVYLLCSRTEGLPYSVLEASYSGLSVVASDLPCLKTTPAIPRLFKFSVGDTHMAAALLKKCFDTPVGEMVTETSFEPFSLSAWAQRESDIMEETNHDEVK